MSELRRRVVLLAVQGLLLGLTASLLIIPVSAIFLERYGSDLLPYTYLVVAVLGAVVSLRIAGALRRLSLVSLALVTMVGLTATIVVSWLLLRMADAVWTSFLLWTLFPLVIQLGFVFIGGSAGRLLDVRQIKRYFPRVVFGFASGFLVGGLVAVPAAATLATEDMLVLTAAAAGALAASFAWSGRRYRVILGTPDPAPPPGTARIRPSAVLRHRYVLLIFGYQFFSAAASQVAEFLLWDRAAARYGAAGELAGFGGILTVILNGANILFLALAAGYLITRFGVRFGLLANPAVVAAMTVVVLLVGVGPGPASGVFFFFAVGTRVLDIIFSDGTTRTAVNATLQAVPPGNRFAAQAAIEGIGVPAAMGAVGVLLIVVDVVGAGTMVVVAAMGIICLVWLAAGWVVFGGYRHNLALRIRRRDLAPGDLQVDTPEAQEVLHGLLASDDPVRVGIALDLLEGADDPRMPDILASLVGHADPGIVAAALSRPAAADLPAATITALADASDGRVRAAAAVALCAADRPAEAMRLLADADSAVRTAAAVSLRRSGDGAAVDLGAWARSDDPADRGDAVRVLAASAALGDADLATLAALRADPDDEVSAAAIRVAAAHPEVPLVDAVSGARHVPAVLAVLAARGDEAAPLLSAALHGDPGPLAGIARRSLVRSAAGMGAGAAAHLLVPLIADSDPEVRSAARRSLVGHRVALAVGDPAVRSALGVDRATAIALFRLQAAAGGDDLLARSLRDAVTALADDVTALADLVVGDQVASRAARVIATGSEGEVATAEETLEVTFSGDIRVLLAALLLPGLGAGTRLALLGVDPEDPTAVLAGLIRGDGMITDPWLRTCAVWRVRTDDDPDLRAAMRVASNAGLDPVLAETLAAVTPSPDPER